VLLEWLAQLLALPVDLLILVAVQGLFATNEVVEDFRIINLNLAATFKFELAKVFLFTVKHFLDWLEYYLSLSDSTVLVGLFRGLTSSAGSDAVGGARGGRGGRVSIGGEARNSRYVICITCSG